MRPYFAASHKTSLGVPLSNIDIVVIILPAECDQMDKNADPTTNVRI